MLASGVIAPMASAAQIPGTAEQVTAEWLSAVLSRPGNPVAVATAESKPKVKAVQLRSLSIVLGTPTTGMPCS